MKKTVHRVPGLLLVLSLILMGMDGTREFGIGQDSLAVRKQDLQARIEMLRSEQDLLLFQKQFSTIDSRYLVLDLARGLGQLKYRSRAFLDFTFNPVSKEVIRTIPRGVQALSKKIEGNGRFDLIFGRAFVLRAKSGVALDHGVPQIVVTPREMRSIFIALEEGSIAYILY